VDVARTRATPANRTMIEAFAARLSRLWRP
jgi:hypothetical protein